MDRIDCSASFSMERMVHSASRMRVFAYEAFGRLIACLEKGDQMGAIYACDTLLQDVELVNPPMLDYGPLGVNQRLHVYLSVPERRFIHIVNGLLLAIEQEVDSI